MSQHNKTLKPLSLAIGATFVASMAAAPLASAATANGNPFAMNDLHSSYSQVAEMKCGEGKCGSSMDKAKTTTEGKCGGNKDKAKTTTEGKCGGSK